MESIITLVVEHLIDPAKRHICFCVSSTNNVRDMHDKIHRLNVAAHDMERKKARYEGNSLVVPYQVPNWLIEYENIHVEVERIPPGGYGCFNIKKRYTAGKKSLNIITRIDDLINQLPEINWTNEQRPLAMPTCSSMPSNSGAVHDDDGTHNNFMSRKKIYEDVLRALDPSNKTQKIALCGIGGVGKTTMMEEIKKDVEHNKMFDCIVRVVIGNKTDPIMFQQAIAEYIGLTLSETAKEAREDRLKIKFLAMSKNGVKKILVILDDVWDMVDLKVIGLASPLPSGFKLLLTTRDERVCNKMDVKANSIFKVLGLEEEEAKLLFWKTVELSDSDDEFHKLGEDILKMCCRLPLAIKTIALSLRGDKKGAWKTALQRLKHHDLEDLDGIMQRIFEISYNNLKKDDKAIFILSGLFPEDFDIPLEDLTRYGWGLKLFYKADSLVEARERTNTSIDNLKRANLLIESYHTSCVKMHDLARAFVLNKTSEFKQASIINYGDYLEWPSDDTREYCERILLKCSGISMFSHDFNYPNLILLKIMTNQEEIIEFPQDFYIRMGKLEVISYRNLLNPLLPVSHQCSASLRTLCLRSCSLPADISFLGDLINLEVLSFAYCNIMKLPSTMGKLQKLKLLDLRGCVDLCIDAGVFRKLEKLEELYMRVLKPKGIRFTEDNCQELQMLFGKLCALEVEIFENILEPKNVSFRKLERFKLSVGCLLDKELEYVHTYSFKNTLKLVTNSSKILECNINQLFVKTEELHLSVNDLNHLEVLLPPPTHRSFCDLKVLCVSDCIELTRLFTIPVVNGMMKLESLSVSSCPLLESLIHDENSGVKEVTLPKLKSLTFKKLPNLLSLCDTTINVMELPQLMELELDDLPRLSCIFSRNDINLSSTKALFNRKVVIPKMEKLVMRRMEKLKELWSRSGDRDEEVNNNISMLKTIEVKECDSVVNIFPSNAMFFLSHLEQLCVKECGSIEVLVNIDLVNGMRKLQTLSISSCHGLKSLVHDEKSGMREISLPKLKSLTLSKLPNLVCLCDTTINIMELPQLMELELFDLPNFSCIFSRNDINLFSMKPLFNKEVVIPKLEQLKIRRMEKLKELWSGSGDRDEEVNNNIFMLKAIEVKECDSVVNIFPSNAMRFMTHLEELCVEKCGSIEVLVNIDLGKTQEFVSLRVIRVCSLKKLREACRIKDGENIISRLPTCIFQALKTIEIAKCEKFKNVFTPTTAHFDMPALEKIRIIDSGEGSWINNVEWVEKKCHVEEVCMVSVSMY